MNEREVFTKLLDFIEGAAYIGAMRAADRQLHPIVLSEHQAVRRELIEALTDEP